MFILAADAAGTVLCWLIGILVVVRMVAAAVPKRCGICQGLIKRSSYTWKVEGKKYRVCPNCNRRMANRKSRAAVVQFFG